ncbi:CD209 antigen-like protein C isoform X2 [Chanodichthys erythropterus]|uniref:CD209 antigen-like protein C isoform X2 n=1 Tax=Chanodichthys erythropterus TaxID=933992 RepID=UPI00351F2E5D
MSMHYYGNMKMDRENKEENIYANEEPNSHDVRTGRQISTTHQTPGSSGDSVRIRNYRAATVCSVLLCVVLLTALIVLGVHIITKSTNYTQETQQLQTKIINLTEEKTQQLQTKIINLTEETQQLQSDYTNLINERDALLSKNNDLIKERNTCRQDFFKENNGWIYNHSSFYYISSEKKSWNESRSYCTERGADLIIINNKEEQDFVEKNIDHGSLVWIGLTDIDEEGSWKWVDGSTPTFRFWWSTEPNGKREENCALVHTSIWADYPCDDAYLWICEKNILI